MAGEASAEAARKSSQEAPRATPEEPEFPVIGDDRAAAFFDLDNTVMQGAALFHFGRGLYKRKFFETRDLARFAWQQAWFRLAGVEDPEHMQDARDSALSIVKGHRVAELESIGEEIYDEYMADRIWPGTRALAQAHLDAGQKVWLVTAAPVEIAQVIARRLGLTGALGTVAESVDGVYTGKLVGEPLHGPAKAEAVRALAAAEGLDLSRCAAYSDSHNDIPMLSWSATPTPSTPTPSSAGTPGRRTGACGTARTRPQGGEGRHPGGGGSRRGGRRHGGGHRAEPPPALAGPHPAAGRPRPFTQFPRSFGGFLARFERACTSPRSTRPALHRNTPFSGQQAIILRNLSRHQTAIEATQSMI